MTCRPDRRVFLRHALVAGAALGSGPSLSVLGLPSCSAAAAAAQSEAVAFPPDIEPLVRVLEDTPRDRLLEEVARRVRAGLSYQDLLAALLLAGVRNVQPRPSVGFKFHAVLVVNSAHLASLASGDPERWLPIFWALDYFKDAQARDEREGNWTMPAAAESALPPTTAAQRLFRAAMDRWDEPAADAAITALARAGGANEIFELFYEYGCRDFRSIGHKAIYVANAQRTLACIGWRHAEPILRSLAYALLNHEGEPNPSQHDLDPDAIGRRNQQRLTQIGDAWLDGRCDDDATAELLGVLRASTADEACDHVVALLNRGISPQSIWDAVHTSAGELLMRQPGIVALHAVTTSNALHFAFRASGHDPTRRLLLLQNVAFLRLFHQAMQGRGKVGDDRWNAFEPASVASDPERALDEIFADVGRLPMAAAGKALGFLHHAPASTLINRARQLVCLKATDSHDYKFSSAALEDHYALSPGWRERYLAMSVFQLCGSAAPDNPLVARTREALRA